MEIFELSREGCVAKSQHIESTLDDKALPEKMLRKSKTKVPEVSELEVVRHFTKLSQKNFCIDSQFYPLGSCTMKYNPRGVHELALLENFKTMHPLTPTRYWQGFLHCLYDLQEYLKEITGMTGVSLAPMAGAQGELAGVKMIKQYHEARGDHQRKVMLVPDSAHGTNPASAVMAGFTIKEVPTGKNGDINFSALKEVVNEHTAGIMLTNPSTLGLFEREISEVQQLIHQAGGLLYYDGANLNAILGKVRPGEMGFDVMHMNMHKTFATPHGGGGPGSGPVAVNDRLKPYLPVPMVDKDPSGQFILVNEQQYPETIGRMSAFFGNTSILLRAYIYLRFLGKEGVTRASDYAVLNANYLKAQFQENGFDLAFPDRMATHEFLLTFQKLAKETGVTAMDLAKRLLDFDCHAPTTYFPLGVPECFLIEPTETESKRELDHFISALTTIVEEAKLTPSKVKNAPYKMPVERLDDVKAAKALNIVYEPA